VKSETNTLDGAVSDPEEADLRQRILGLMEDQSVAPLLEATLSYQQKCPGSAWGWLVAVPTLIDLGRYKQAKKALKKAQKLSHPDAKPQLHYWRSMLFKEQGELAQAEHWIRRALAREPENGSFWVTLGDVLARRGKLKAARKAHEHAVAVGDANVDEAYFNLALLLRAQRRYPEALNQVMLALDIDPNYAQATALKQDLEAVLQSG